MYNPGSKSVRDQHGEAHEESTCSIIDSGWRPAAGEEPNCRLYAHLHSIDTPPVSYLVAESGGDQGGHDDHGDNDLDGGGSGSHLEYILCLLLLFHYCARRCHNTVCPC
jgi:hypothetical protein